MLLTGGHGRMRHPGLGRTDMFSAAHGKSGNSLGPCGQGRRRSAAEGTSETMVGDLKGGEEQCENPWSLQEGEEQSIQRRYKVPFHTHRLPSIYPLQS